MSGYQGSRLHAPTHAHQGSCLFVVQAQPHACAPTGHQGLNLRPAALGHSQCKTLSQSLRQLTTYYLWYFADVAAYLLKKEVKKK